MQKVRVQKVSVKRGENKNGPWVNYRITSDKGVVFSTFHKSASEIGDGDLIEIEPEVTDKGNNFDDFNIIEKGTGAAASSGNGESPAGGAYKRDTEGIRFEYGLKAHLQAIERASIEGQTAYNGIIELIKSDKCEDVSEYIAMEAIEWARAKMKATLAVTVPSEPTGAKSDKGKDPAPSETPAPAAEEEPIAPSFPHVGGLLKWCAEKGIDRKSFMSLVGVGEEDLARVDIETAYTLISDHLREKGQLEADIFGGKHE